MMKIIFAVVTAALFVSCTTPQKTAQSGDVLRKPASNDNDNITLLCQAAQDPRQTSEINMLFDPSTQRYSGSVQYFKKAKKKAQRAMKYEYRINTEASDKATRQAKEKLVLTDGGRESVFLDRQPSAEGVYKAEIKSKSRFFTKQSFDCKTR